MAQHVLSLEAPDTMNKGICAYIHCNKEFTKTRRSRKFCCQRCGRAAKRLEYGRWVFTNEIIKCKGCDTQFVKTHKHKLYCDTECMRKHTCKEYYMKKRDFILGPEGRLRVIKRHKYRKYKKDTCELCNFKAMHSCQLDIDHIDGNSSNNDPNNLQTLCANCHRLKTFLNRDGVYGKSNETKLCSMY